MKYYSLKNLTNDVNSALNYPAISFTDIKLYLNQAISELNTSLHISIKDVDALIRDCEARSKVVDNLIYLQSEPTEQTTVPQYSEAPVSGRYYFDTTKKKFGAKNVYDTWIYTNDLYAMCYVDAEQVYYKATPVIADNDTITILWFKADENPYALNLLEFFTMDWITLFIIPYICFKFSSKDNDTGAIFSEDFTQGYQQLLMAYNIPFTEYLPNVADKTAYYGDVVDNLNNLAIHCPCRRIAESMRIPRDIQATYGSMYDGGGW